MAEHLITKLDQGMFGYKNVFQGIYLVAKKEGVLSLWKGCGARVLHMGTQAAINLSLLEKFRQMILNNFFKK